MDLQGRKQADRSRTGGGQGGVCRWDRSMDGDGCVAATRPGKGHL